MSFGNHGLAAPCRFFLWLGVIALTAGLAPAQTNGQDRPVRLSVNAADAPRHTLHSRLLIPAKPGPMTLVYPKWIPGEHGPNGPIADLAGLRLNAAGKTIPWCRDDVDMYAVHCEVPSDAGEVAVDFDFLTPPPSAGAFSAGASTSAKLAVISWNQLVFYPQGRSPRDLQVEADLTVPPGWKIATALPAAASTGELTNFDRVSLETLIDSPALAAAYLKDVPIGPHEAPRHFLHMASDSREGLEIGEALEGKLDRLIAEAGAMFGSRHYRSYHFLLALSDHVTHFGLEHHESSDNRVAERTLIDDGTFLANAALLPHEYVHSWNGKYRRPLDMATKDFQEPQRTHLLWVYEGLTDYLGSVLTARSGLYSPEQFRDSLALNAQYASNSRGRSWRPLQDGAVAFHTFDSSRTDGSARRRGGWDVYVDGGLIWLEVDCLIRRQTQGRRSLDDFCRRFFGGPSGAPMVKPYTLDELAADLNAVAPYDWAKLFADRVTLPLEQPPLGGIELSGWRLTYADAPTELQNAWDQDWGDAADLSASIGLSVKNDGAVADVIPDEAADRAGIAPNMKIVAVNGRRFSTDVLRAAIAATGESDGRLELLAENADYFQTYTLDYHGGEKYPRLQRDDSKPDLLAEITKPLTGQESAASQPAAKPGPR